MSPIPPPMASITTHPNCLRLRSSRTGSQTCDADEGHQTLPTVAEECAHLVWTLANHESADFDSRQIEKMEQELMQVLWGRRRGGSGAARHVLPSVLCVLVRKHQSKGAKSGSERSE